MKLYSTFNKGPAFTKDYSLICMGCGNENDEHLTQSYCMECGSVLEIRFTSTSVPWQLPLSLDTQPDLIRNYVTQVKVFQSLSQQLDIPLYGKLELANPSGSFKDRGTYVEIMKAIELGKSGIAVASTGNMAASVALYCYHFQLPCTVFVPKGTNSGKLLQAAAAQPIIIEIDGNYATCEQIAKEYAQNHNLFLAGDYEFRLQGQKSFAYELLIDFPAMDLDYIIVPVGCGTNISAIARGLTEMQTCGIITRMPQLVGVQAEGSSPLVASSIKGQKVIWESVNTIAQATAVSNPIDFPKVQRALEQTNGFMLKVKDEVVIDAMDLQYQKEGIFAEPSGCLPLAAVMTNQDCFRNANTLLVISGHGLKDPYKYQKN